MVSLLPFLPVYMAYVGLNPVQVGIVLGIEPFIGMFASPLCGSLADKLGMHRFIMVGSIIGTGLIYGSGVFVSLIDTSAAVNWTNVSNAMQDGAHERLGRALFEQQQTNCTLCLNTSKSHSEDCIFNRSQYITTDDITRSSVDSKATCQNCLIDNCRACFYKHRTKDGILHVFTASLDSDTTGVARNQRLNFTVNTALIPMEPSSKVLSTSKRKKADIQSQKQSLEKEVSEQKDTTLAFVLILVIVLAGQFISNPAVPLLDAATMAMAKESTDRGQKVEYGHQRLWGAIAWGVFAPLSGFAVDAYSKAYPDTFNKYLPAFVSFTAVVLLSVVPALFIRFLPHRPPESLASNLGTLLRRPKVLVFLYAMFTTGVSVGVISTYIFLFLAELSGSHTIMGLTLTFTCVAEVPFMFFASKLIARLGHRGVFVLTLFCYTLRFVGYSILQNPWLVLPIELLHGITYGALWPACTSYINLNTPDNLLTTMQSITFGIKCGLGEGVGTLLGGVIYHTYGARNLFRGSAGFCLATVFFYWPMSAYLDRREEIQERRIQYEEI